MSAAKRLQDLQSAAPGTARDADNTRAKENSRRRRQMQNELAPRKYPDPNCDPGITEFKNRHSPEVVQLVADCHMGDA